MSLFHCKIWLQGQAWKIMFSGYYPLWVRFLSCENPNSYGPSGQQTPAFTQVFEVRPKRCYRKILVLLLLVRVLMVFCTDRRNSKERESKDLSLLPDSLSDAALSPLPAEQRSPWLGLEGTPGHRRGSHGPEPNIHKHTYTPGAFYFCTVHTHPKYKQHAHMHPSDPTWAHTSQAQKGHSPLNQTHIHIP